MKKWMVFGLIWFLFGVCGDPFLMAAPDALMTRVWKKDPFVRSWMESLVGSEKPPSKPVQKIIETPLYELQALYSVGQVRKAVISGKTYRMGDRLSSYFVSRIGVDDVVLTHVNGQSQIRLTFV